MNKIVLKNVSKSYQNIVAVNHVNLSIKANEFVVLTGPSGCGKTTLLRLIAGLEELDEGEILIDNQSAARLKPHQRNLSMVFQDSTLYPHLTVFNNIALSLKLERLNKILIEQRVRKIAALLGLNDLLKRKPNALSGGQRQRVAIACALIKKPSIILFDEPVSSLDIPARKEILKIIEHIKKEIKVTYLYVTHDVSEAKTLADRVIYMENGKII